MTRRDPISEAGSNSLLTVFLAFRFQLPPISAADGDFMLLFSLAEAFEFEVQLQVVDKTLPTERALGDGGLNRAAFVGAVFTIVKLTLRRSRIEISKAGLQGLRIRPHVDFTDAGVVDQHTATL